MTVSRAGGTAGGQGQRGNSTLGIAASSAYKVLHGGARSGAHKASPGMINPWGRWAQAAAVNRDLHTWQARHQAHWHPKAAASHADRCPGMECSMRGVRRLLAKVTFSKVLGTILSPPR